MLVTPSADPFAFTEQVTAIDTWELTPGHVYKQVVEVGRGGEWGGEWRWGGEGRGEGDADGDGDGEGYGDMEMGIWMEIEIELYILLDLHDFSKLPRWTWIRE